MFYRPRAVRIDVSEYGEQNAVTVTEWENGEGIDVVLAPQRAGRAVALSLSHHELDAVVTAARLLGLRDWSE
tara:strand:- start:695 stop:910 length:216 start_codon:yes stop_codon:yes gene_type:complete